MVEQSEIKQKAQEWRNTNGNKHVPNKDMLIYIIERLDKLPCLKHGENIVSALTRTRILQWVVTTWLTLISLVLVLQNII